MDDKTSRHRHFKIYKPARCLSQFVTQQRRRKNKRMLGELYDFPEGTMAIGRLDENSEGLLLLTTDGMVSEVIRSRKYEKEYYAQVDGIITQEAIDRMRAGVEIGVKGEKYTSLPCKAHAIDVPDLPAGHRIRDERHGPTSWVSITLTEGKYRQVRKMTAAVGFPTLRLVRVRIGSIHLKDMEVGGVVELADLLGQ